MASVSKRGKTWEIRYRVKDAMGQITQKRVGGFKTKEEAWAKAGQIEQAAQMNVEQPKSDLTVGMLLERWFSEYAAQSVEQTTLARYNMNIDRLSHFPIYNEPVKNLTKARYGQMFNYMQSCGGQNGKPLKTSTVKVYFDVLRNSTSWAASENIIPLNPLAGYKIKKIKQDSYKEPDYLDPNDIQDVLNACKGKRIYTPILLAIYGGLRAEECCGLKWKSINFSRNTLIIIEAKTRDVYGRKIDKGPKSPMSKRTISMPQFVMDYLNQLPRESEFVCVSRKREPYSINSLTNTLKRIEEQINEKRKYTNQPPIPPASFHDLRHTHAAMLIKLNIQPKIISERLGHSSIAITMDTYGYLMTGLQEDVANKLNTFC